MVDTENDDEADSGGAAKDKEKMSGFEEIDLKTFKDAKTDDEIDGRQRASDEEILTETHLEMDTAEPQGAHVHYVTIPDELEVDETSTKVKHSYAAKKTVAQGMMDIALITANANQLRYIIEFNSSSKTYYLNLCLITISLLLQVAVGISLIFKGRMDLRGESHHANAKRINNYVVVGIFLVTIINVFIASFTITGNNAAVTT